MAPVSMPSNLLGIAVTLLGLFFAVYLGVAIGGTEFKTLALVFLAALGLIYAIFLHRWVWHLALFTIFAGFTYRPTSFAFGSVELSCALAAGVAAIFVWQKRATTQPEILKSRKFTVMQSAILVWLVYVGLHFIYNIKLPYRPEEFVLTNAIKSYFAMAAPLVVLLYFLRSPAGIVAKRTFFVRVAQLCALGLFINLVIRAFELGAGMSTLYVPILNLTPNQHALRTLGPVSMLIGIAGLTASDVGRASPIQRLTYWFLLVGGGLGATASGGRASVVFGFALVVGVLCYRRRIVILSLFAAGAVIGIAAANLSSDWINNRADPFIRRSLQIVLIDKNWDSMESIESSSRWRLQLRQRAIAEWRTDARTFWFGRATFGFGTADQNASFRIGSWEAGLQAGLRRAATHNLITDLLVAYGLIGCILYLGVYVMILRYIWFLLRHPDLTQTAKNLALVCFIYGAFGLAYDIVVGGTFPIDVIWYLIVLTTGIYSGCALLPKPKEMPTHALQEHQPTRRARFRPSKRILAT